MLHAVLCIGFDVAFQSVIFVWNFICFIWKYRNVLFAITLTAQYIAYIYALTEREKQTIQVYAVVSALACSVLHAISSCLWDTALLVASFLWNYWNFFCPTIVFFIIGHYCYNNIEEPGAHYERAQSPHQQQRQHEASNIFSHRRSHDSSNRNNHDLLKYKHDTRESAEAEIRRMQQSNNYKDSELLNSYYNSELGGWFVGNRSRH
jgi:hypothetical protein